MANQVSETVALAKNLLGKWEARAAGCEEEINRFACDLIRNGELNLLKHFSNHLRGFQGRWLTAYLYAIKYDRSRAIRILNPHLPSEAINQPLDGTNDTALHRAVGVQSGNVLHAVLSHGGVQVNLTDGLGRTPADMACLKIIHRGADAQSRLIYKMIAEVGGQRGKDLSLEACRAQAIERSRAKLYRYALEKFADRRIEDIKGIIFIKTGLLPNEEELQKLQ